MQSVPISQEKHCGCCQLSLLRYSKPLESHSCLAVWDVHHWGPQTKQKGLLLKDLTLEHLDVVDSFTKLDPNLDLSLNVSHTRMHVNRMCWNCTAVSNRNDALTCRNFMTLHLAKLGFLVPIFHVYVTPQMVFLRGTCLVWILSKTQ